MHIREPPLYIQIYLVKFLKYRNARLVSCADNSASNVNDITYCSHGNSCSSSIKL